MNGNLLLPIAAGLLAASLWGGWMPVTRIGVTQSLNPGDIVFLRFMTATIIATPWLWWYGCRPGPNLPLWRIGILTIGSGIGYVLFAAFGFLLAPASFGAVIPSTMMAFSFLIAALLLNQKFTRKSLGSVAIILTGVCIFIFESTKIEANYVFGIFFFILSGFVFACYNVALKVWKLNPFHAVSIVSLYSFLSFAPFYLLFFEINIFSAPIREVTFQILYQGIIVSFISLVLFSFASIRLGSARASLLAVWMPVSGVLLSVAFLGESLTSTLIIALGLMIIGILTGIAPLQKKEAGRDSM